MSSLPERACLVQYRRQAKELLLSALSGDAKALDEFRRVHPKSLEKPKLRLTDAQYVIAKLNGFASWPKFRSAVVALEAREFFEEVNRADVEAVKRRLARLPELIHSVNEDGSSALHLAAEHNDVPLAEVLVDAGADLRQRFGQSAHTALSWAITVGSFDFARELVRLGDRPDLFSAAGLGDLAIVQSFWVEGRLQPNACRRRIALTTSS